MVHWAEVRKQAPFCRKKKKGLVIFDPTKWTEIWADASREWGTVGAVLMQDHRLGLRPVAFLSKVMTKEQLMIALEEWRHYLLPLSFMV